VLIGRNNRQNDQLTFRLAGDLWFHAQEIPGSHVLLRLEPGTVPDEADLQLPLTLPPTVAPAKVTKCQLSTPDKVYKPKGAKPGIAIYKQERILWGQPQRGHEYLKQVSQKLLVDFGLLHLSFGRVISKHVKFHKKICFPVYNVKRKRNQ